MIFWMIPILISLAISVLMYMLMPKPKAQKSASVSQGSLDNPTADAGREIPVPFGTISCKSPNCLWYGEKGAGNYNIKG